MTQYRLLARAEMHGAIREPGYIFTLAEGELGPHRTVVASNHGAQITEHMNADTALLDEPLYEEVKEPDAAEVRASERKQLEAHVADLRKQLVEAEGKLIDLGHEDGKPLLLEAPESNLPAKS